MANDKYAPEDDRPHVDTAVCGKCRFKIARGERVFVAHIFESSGVNPMDLGNRGVHLFEEFELVHVDCRDTFLKKGLRLI